MKPLRVLDLFSGIGGFSYGLENTGHFKTVAFCEIDPHARAVLRKHWPKTVIFEDIKELNCTGTVDVICGGFPCQDISVAGRQRGINEETRSGLWYEYHRLIQEVKPRWVIIENVRNLLSNGLSTVLKDLSDIGYDAEWEIISARSVGACHLRERVWIVAYPSGQRLQGQRESRRISEKQPSLNSIYDIPTNSDCKSVRNESSKLHNERGRPRTSREESLLQEDEKAQNLEFRTGCTLFTHSDHFRFWPSFTTAEEKLKWWSEATSGIRDWWQVESTICRVDDGLPRGLDKGRTQRIKQLGNSIVPQIAQIIGERIAYHEGR